MPIESPPPLPSSPSPPQKKLPALLEISGQGCEHAVYYSHLSYKSIWVEDRGRKKNTGEDAYSPVY